MNRRELIRKASVNSGILQKDLEASMNALVKTIADLLCEGNRINIKGVGTFEIYTRKSRMFKNPRTGIKVFIKSKKTVKFVIHKSFLNRLNPDGNEYSIFFHIP